MRTKHLFFDLDRTLWDFEKNSEIALMKLFEEFKSGHGIDDFDHFHLTYKEHNARLWKMYGNKEIDKEHLRDERFRVTFADFNIHDPDLTTKFSDGYVEISPRQTALFPETIETLVSLKKDSYNLHIITNGFKEVQYIKLENSGLDGFFDIILCSEEVGHNKPSPIIFNHALKEACAEKKDSVMIGDDLEVDVIGAINFGIQGILFDPDNHYRNLSDTPRIQQLDELKDLLPWIFRTTS
ncbi:MAG: YjjG family noncanonical pyrimidine nucleotidase [Flavobacteriia bacterium]|jgi:putative hydrolase of the HAD superfamily